MCKKNGVCKMNEVCAALIYTIVGTSMVPTINPGDQIEVTPSTCVESYDKEDMDELKLKMRQKGFKGAFVVAFYQGNKISIKEALSLQKK